MMVLFILTILLSSCTVSLPKTVTVNLKDSHMWEEIQGHEMYYTLKYFDGDGIVSVNLDPGIRKVQIRVRDGGLRPIIAVPIGKLSPLGGFYYPGYDGDVCLYRENGTFANLLINASEYMPDAVSNLNYERVKMDGIDLEVIEQERFLNDLFSGSISESSFVNTKLYSLSLDMLPSGYWYRDNPRADNIFIKNSGNRISMKLFPGAYYWANFDRGVFFSLIITEGGEAYTGIVKLPKWY